MSITNVRELSWLIIMKLLLLLCAMHRRKSTTTGLRLASPSIVSTKHYLASTDSSEVPQTTKTLAPGSHLSELVVKKSRFLAYAQHAETWEEAQGYIAKVHDLHPKGRHWCFGFQCGVNPVTERCSDDGEPTGTAGVPILGALCVGVLT